MRFHSCCVFSVSVFFVLCSFLLVLLYFIFMKSFSYSHLYIYFYIESCSFFILLLLYLCLPLFVFIRCVWLHLRLKERIKRLKPYYFALLSYAYLGLCWIEKKRGGGCSFKEMGGILSEWGCWSGDRRVEKRGGLG